MAKRSKNPRHPNIPGKKQNPKSCHTYRFKLMRRFYEPLVLLHTLGPTRGDRTRRSPSIASNKHAESFQDLRRQFLNDLAYTCDFDKGGDTVTAIALESNPQTSVFWIATNKSTEATVEQVDQFIKSLLGRLQTISQSDGTSKEADLKLIARMCAYFAHKRIERYFGLFRQTLRKCEEYWQRCEGSGMI